MTIGWMLATLTTLVCGLGVLLGQLYYAANREVEAVGVMVELLFFASVVIGLASLALMVLAQRIRRVPAPPGIVLATSIIGSVPLLLLIVRLLQ